jgi:hypothetical protein
VFSSIVRVEQRWYVIELALYSSPARCNRLFGVVEVHPELNTMILESNAPV